jgi:hypothetical protein
MTGMGGGVIARRGSAPIGAGTAKAWWRRPTTLRRFDEISCLVDLIAEVDQALPAASMIRNDPLFTKLRAHRKIDHLDVVTSNLPPQLSNASDFSRASIEARIQAGYQDAMQQGIGDVDAPGLRFGVTARAVQDVGVTG